MDVSLGSMRRYMLCMCLWLTVWIPVCMFLLMQDNSKQESLPGIAEINKKWSKFGSKSNHNPLGCKDKLCREHLSVIDNKFFTACLNKVQQTDTQTPPITGNCHFMNGENRAPVALASLPGSGNTWIRGLLEQATGICTGSAHSCDVELRLGGFNGEAIRSSSVLVVKTHKIGPGWTRSNTTIYSADGSPLFGSAIVLIRSPLDAILAEWNRQATNSHIGLANMTTFSNSSKWSEFVHKMTSRWKSYISGWVINKQSRPVLVVKYENIKANPVTEVKRMLKFLGVSISSRGTQQRLEKKFTRFERRHSESYNLFTTEQREHSLLTLQKTIDILISENHGETYGITEYLMDMYTH